MLKSIAKQLYARERQTRLENGTLPIIKINGVVVLMKKKLLDINDPASDVLDRVHELVGQRVSLQLISAVHCDPANGMRGKLGKAAYLENWITKITPPTTSGTAFNIKFDWDESEGVPGAFIIKNNHHSEFYLRTVTLEGVPGAGRIHFVCNSWVYPTHYHKYNRVFFTNKTCLPSSTPEPLVKYREEELQILRGDGSGELNEWDRVYDYAFYNDLGEPDKDADHVRPVLGGSTQYPYPRRGKTGRPPTKTDPNTESRLPLLSLNYVPSDERFGHLKLSDILARFLKALAQLLKSEMQQMCGSTKNEFETFQDVLSLYEGGIKLPSSILDTIRDAVPLEILKELLRTDGEQLFKLPVPQVIQEDKFAWRTDEEFAREMLAGLHPVSIRLLQDFPPISKLDPKEYGNQTSSITKQHIEKNLEGQTVEEAIEKKKLFILDHHDTLMPYLNRINTTTTKMYATRTLLFLNESKMLKPLVIELSLPHPNGERYGAINKIYTPAEEGVEASVWQLAKAYVLVNDSGVHQLISHWLKSHAVIEPFVIATHRQLSVMHPVHKLLHPHFRDTMIINALGRQLLINAGGLMEKTLFPARYSMEFTSLAYKSWVFTDQALPEDLIKRGIAIPDPNRPNGLHLLIEDYPYAVDGLEIWSAIEAWVDEYCSYYYPTDETVQDDSELQSWWKELRNEGHGDKKEETWWPMMQTRTELTQTCTIIIWVASAFHAALNVGQFPYAGYYPNRPTISRRFMPEPGTLEYEELVSNPDSAYLKTIGSQFIALIGVSLIEILSRHSTDEVYLGQRDTPEWTTDSAPLKAFQNFREKLIQIENKITDMNRNKHWKNRTGPVKMPYTLLYPNTSDYTHKGGLTGKGIPNSISI